MHYMAGAWAVRLRNLEKEAKHIIQDDGSCNPLVKQETYDDLRERYRIARYWHGYWLQQES